MMARKLKILQKNKPSQEYLNRNRKDKLKQHFIWDKKSTWNGIFRSKLIWVNKLLRVRRVRRWLNFIIL